MEEVFETTLHYEAIQRTQDDMFYAFNRGDMPKIRSVFSDFEIVDRRATDPMLAKLKIKFPPGMTWKPYQPLAVEKMLEEEYGLLQAPPRSGKTLIIAACVCAERLKTIVFAHQTDLLFQLFDTFERFTNLKEIRSGSLPVVEFAKEIEDFDNLDVALCTKQTFDNFTNRQKLAVVQRLFGSVWVDEGHLTAADLYSRYLNRFHAQSRRTVSATPHRKDRKDFIIQSVMGPIVHIISKEEVKQVPMEVLLISTGITPKKKSFVHVLSELAVNEKRNKFLLDWMESDVKAGRHLVAVTDRSDHCKGMTKMLQARGVPAIAFNGSIQDRGIRKKILNQARSGEAKVLVVMRSMTTGLDIPCADTFHNLMPSANAVKDGEHEGSGGYEQQCTRILTEFPGKKMGLVRDYIDRCGLAFACLNERQKTYDYLGAKVLKSRGYIDFQEIAVPDMGEASSTSF